MFKESISKEELDELPLISFIGDVVVIDDDNQSDAENYLSKQTIIGFDTESRASFKKGVQNTISLIQLSGKDKTFLIRLNKTSLSDGMIKILQSRKIKKIGVAIKDDLKNIKDNRDFFPHGFIDLQVVVGQYGIKDIGLKKMCGIVLHGRISKAQRLSNWNAVTLTEAQITYAATDAWVCREIFLELKNAKSLSEREIEK